MLEGLDSKALVSVSGEGWIAAFATAADSPDLRVPAALARQAGAWAAATLGYSPPVLYGDQQHTAIIFSFAAHLPLAPQPHCVGVCDGLLTAEAGVALMVRTADCLPVVLAGGGVVAGLHCGWRSLAGDILGRCVRRFSTEYGIKSGALQAIIGVGIGPCHYLVGADVVSALSSLPAAASGWSRDGRVDLAAWTRGRLISMGVAAEAVRTLPGCTACSPCHHSFRRDGTRAGRQWTAVVLL